MTDLLKQYGFTFFGICNCSGTRNEKYYNGRYMFYLQPKRRLFKIKEGNQTVQNPTPYADIITYLEKYAKKVPPQPVQV